jgi:hypothetical protein
MREVAGALGRNHDQGAATIGEWPIMTPEHEISPHSIVHCHDVPRQIALYYRELFAHKLGVTRAERYFAYGTGSASE